MGVAKWPAFTGYSLCAQARWEGERCPRYSRGFNVLKFMYIRSRQSQVCIVSWASAVEGCPLSGVPLYMYNIFVSQIAILMH